jgi:hypothetical protein
MKILNTRHLGHALVLLLAMAQLAGCDSPAGRSPASSSSSSGVANMVDSRHLKSVIASVAAQPRISVLNDDDLLQFVTSMVSTPLARYSTILSTPMPFSAQYYFVPNQMEDVWWNAANGRIEGSFSSFSLWQNLMGHLAANHGGFGMYAPEVPNTTAGTLAAMRKKGLAIEVEPPGMTQQSPIADIISSELYGNGSMAQSLKIPAKGYFVTSDGVPITPDELLMDERIPSVLYAGYEKAPQVIQDYVAYSQAIRQKWPKRTPAYSFAWNVVPGWSNNTSPPPDGSNSFQVLAQLIQALCDSGQCPRTAYLDVEWPDDTVPQWNAQTLLSTLVQTKAILQSYGVGFGILLSGDAGMELKGDTLQLAANKSATQTIGPFPCSGSGCNFLFQNSEMVILNWLVAQGIVDGSTKLHIQSWYSTPIEAGANVAETISGTMANTGDRIFQEILIPNQLAH